MLGELLCDGVITVMFGADEIKTKLKLNGSNFDF